MLCKKNLPSKVASNYDVHSPREVAWRQLNRKETFLKNIIEMHKLYINPDVDVCICEYHKQLNVVRRIHERVFLR